MPSTNTTKTNKKLACYCYLFSNTKTKQFIDKFFCRVREKERVHTIGNHTREKLEVFGKAKASLLPPRIAFAFKQDIAFI